MKILRAMLALASLTACHGTAGAQSSGRPEPVAAEPIPAMPLAEGPPRIAVIYPKWEDLVDAPDTSFIFGSTGDGRAAVTVNGYPATVWPNGAWFAWIPFPQDSLMSFDVVARSPSGRDSLRYLAQRVPRFQPPAERLWVDTTAVFPRGEVWWPAGENLPVTVPAAPGASARLILPGGREIQLVPDIGLSPAPWGVRAFDWQDESLDRRTPSYFYTTVVRGLETGPDPGDMLGPRDSLCPACEDGSNEAQWPIIELAREGDTLRVPWRVSLRLADSFPRVVSVNDDPDGAGDTDGITVGRSSPGATFHWFLPRGTRSVATARVGGMVRLALSSATEAWIPADEVVPLSPGLPAPGGRVGFITVRPLADRLHVRIPLGARVPFRVSETARTLQLRFYRTHGDPSWIRYGGTDPLLELVDWSQDRSDETTVTFTLAKPVWGYRTSWDRDDLILEIRRPPAVDDSAPLVGRRIVIDPGHPPVGAKGPTGLTEAEANLAVALKLRDLLLAAGAEVIMTRTEDVAVGLAERVALADSVDAEVLISIHNNALPDGVNPFVNNGSSVFYFHPRSVLLAKRIQERLHRGLGLRNLGVSRGNLALARPTWMPAVLTEGLFIMLPDQEHALRTEEGQLGYARAVAEGLERYLAEWSTGAGPEAHH